MIRYRQAALDVLFVATEAVVWFIALRVIATIAAGTFWSDVTANLEAALVEGAIANPEAARALLPALRDAAEVAGPSLLVVLVAALGAFGLERLVARAGLDGPLGAFALLLGSVLALNVVFRLALESDWRLWDFSGFVSDQRMRSPGEVDLNALVERGSVEGLPNAGLHGSTLALTLAGLTLLWVRFLIAARARVMFPRVLRSVSIGFAAALVTMIIGGIADVPGVSSYVAAHFVMGVVTLAVANNARAALPVEGEGRGAVSWLIAMSGTVGVLVSVALVVALLAFLNVGIVLEAIGSVALRVIEVLLYIIITPIYWLMELLFNLVLGGNEQPANPIDPGEPEPPQEPGESTLPGWIGNLIRTLAVVAFVVMLYYLARLILGRRSTPEPEVAEVRSRTSGGASLRDVLRGMMPRFGRDHSDAWMDRHPVYRLYGRVLSGARDRGFHAMDGETPIEFSERASATLSAPFVDVGRAFDRARYGRHFPAADEVRAMEQRVAQWEREVPATRELREQLSGAPQMSEADEFTLRIERRRATLRGDAERMRQLGEDETR